MIAVDTSALMAILLGEPESDSLISALEADPDVLISAAIVAEAMIVAGRRNVADEMERLIEDLGLTIVPVTAAAARRVAEAYAVWGKGVHPAALNFGDCFSYALARDYDCPLLYVGKNFAATDLAVRPLGGESSGPRQSPEQTFASALVAAPNGAERPLRTPPSVLKSS